MPLGRTHTIATLVTTTIVPPTILALGYPLLSCAALAGGCLTGVFLTPDLDVDTGCYSMGVIRRLAGRPVAWLWRAYWWPYAKCVHHRSVVSHMPIIGTAIRLLYLLAPVIAVGWYAHWPLPTITPLALWFAVGLALSDLLHFLMDAVEWRRFGFFVDHHHARRHPAHGAHSHAEAHHGRGESWL